MDPLTAAVALLCLMAVSAAAVRAAVGAGREPAGPAWWEADERPG